jgi:hypothetical protein
MVSPSMIVSPFDKVVEQMYYLLAKKSPVTIAAATMQIPDRFDPKSLHHTPSNSTPTTSSRLGQNGDTT